MKPLNFGLFHVEQPPEIYAGLTRLDLTPMAARILARLAAVPSGVPRERLMGINGRVKTPDTLRVHLHAIRHALPRELGLEYVPDAEAYRLAFR